MGLQVQIGTQVFKFYVPIKKILAKVLVFMGGLGVWAQGSCVDKAGVGVLSALLRVVLLRESTHSNQKPTFNEVECIWAK